MVDGSDGGVSHDTVVSIIASLAMRLIWVESRPSRLCSRVTVFQFNDFQHRGEGIFPK